MSDPDKDREAQEYMRLWRVMPKMFPKYSVVAPLQSDLSKFVPLSIDVAIGEGDVVYLLLGIWDVPEDVAYGNNNTNDRFVCSFISTALLHSISKRYCSRRELGHKTKFILSALKQGWIDPDAFDQKYPSKNRQQCESTITAILDQILATLTDKSRKNLKLRLPDLKYLLGSQKRFGKYYRRRLEAACYYKQEFDSANNAFTNKKTSPSDLGSPEVRKTPPTSTVVNDTISSAHLARLRACLMTEGTSEVIAGIDVAAKLRTFQRGLLGKCNKSHHTR
ncbi:hypothetical protein DFS34DRAFT_598050 [Phlyctochytrium arcticum]|nr:hypothetical protein DFS34DRAFT_598050 [Phlyctochytrium arcticum]